MLQNISNLDGVTVLSKEQQKNVNGGQTCEMLDIDKPENYKVLYSPTGFYDLNGNPKMVAVGESCKWNCWSTDRRGNKVGDPTPIWGGCGL